MRSLFARKPVLVSRAAELEENLLEGRLEAWVSTVIDGSEGISLLSKVLYLVAEHIVARSLKKNRSRMKIGQAFRTAA